MLKKKIKNKKIKPPFCTKDVFKNSFLAIGSRPSPHHHLKTSSFGPQHGTLTLFIGTLSLCEFSEYTLSFLPLLLFQGLFEKNMPLLEHFHIDFSGCNSLTHGYSTGRRKPAFWLEVSTLARMVMRPRNLMPSLYSCPLYKVVCLGHGTAT